MLCLGHVHWSIIQLMERYLSRAGSGTRVDRTLADLGPGVTLYGHCNACGRMERLERKALGQSRRLA